MVEAIVYVLEGGCAWRRLPDSFSALTTVQRYFHGWRNDGTRKRLNHPLLMHGRERMGREAGPNAGVIGSQLAKTADAGGVRGYDAGKPVQGRKHHIIIDTNGLMVSAVFHGADIQDRDGTPSALAGRCNGLSPG